ncbi:Uncharacterised protein [Streptococcus suis]|uniref:Uncharacterized protein n=1 Tax=Streptococcus suis TaxID=1307 RepID=A0A0Z8DN30_STRSU|nr:Uncharacterised protein [Streptococcus suis]
MKIPVKKLVFLLINAYNKYILLFENQNYPLSTRLDELQFYLRLRFLDYF